MKLTVQLKSRLRDMEAATCCTLFLLRSSAVVTVIQSTDTAYNDMETNQPDKERVESAFGSA